MEKKVGILIGVVTLAIFGVAVAFLTKPVAKTGVTNLTRGNEIVRGSRNAPNIIVEFSDYECPACAKEAPILAELAERYPDKVQVILRHLPIPGHKWSTLAAKAVEAAGKQGKFWEMNDKLFEQQQEWIGKGEIKNYLLGLVEELGMDKDKFLVDWASEKVEVKVTRDFNDGVILGVVVTPTFFVNGTKISGGRTLGDWEKLLKL